MARYFLHIRHKDRLIEDDEGFDFPSLTEARREVVQGLRCILADALIADRQPSADAIDVTDEAGVVLTVVSITEVLPASLIRKIVHGSSVGILLKSTGLHLAVVRVCRVALGASILVRVSYERCKRQRW